MTAASIVNRYARALAVAGPVLLVAVLVADRRWTHQGLEILALIVLGIPLRGVTVSLSKYSYLTQTGLVVLAGVLLVGAPATALALAVVTLATDWVWHRKPLFVAGVNVGRELVALLAAFGVYAWTLELHGIAAPQLDVTAIPPVFFLVLTYVVASRLLFYFTLLLRGKLRRDEELLLLRYECISAFATVVAAAVVVVSVRLWPPGAWPFIGAALVACGLLLRQILSEAIAAEELNKIHAVESVITSDVALDDAFSRIERLARRVVDWGDLRVYRMVGGEARLAHRSATGRPNRGEPPPDIAALRAEVVRTGTPMVVADTGRDPRIREPTDAVQTVIVLPLRFGDRVLGTLELEHHKRNSYRPSDLVTITTFANQLATAIHIGDLRQPLVETVERLGAQLATLTSTAAALRDAAAAVAGSTAAIRHGALSETDEVQSGLAVTAELADLTRRVASDGLEAARASSQASDVAERHRPQIQEAIERLVALKSFVGETSRQVQALGQVSRRITGFIASIRELAEMTNLLALNAAIEAARAGTHGRRFGVVAGEVRQLAEQSAAAAAEAGELVQNIHRRVGEVVEQMRRGQVNVGGVEELSAGALGALDRIVEATAEATEHARRIAASAETQGGAFDGLRVRMDAVASIAERNRGEADDVTARADETARGLGELERATRELEQVAAMLRSLTHSFASVRRSA